MTIALNDDFRFKGANYSTSQTTSTLARHRWYVIKEGFSPKLVEEQPSMPPRSKRRIW